MGACRGGKPPPGRCGGRAPRPAGPDGAPGRAPGAPSRGAAQITCRCLRRGGPARRRRSHEHRPARGARAAPVPSSGLRRAAEASAARCVLWAAASPAAPPAVASRARARASGLLPRVLRRQIQARVQQPPVLRFRLGLRRREHRRPPWAREPRLGSGPATGTSGTISCAGAERARRRSCVGAAGVTISASSSGGGAAGLAVFTRRGGGNTAAGGR